MEEDLRSSGEGLRGFESHPPHLHVENAGEGCPQVTSLVFSLPEDSGTVEVAHITRALYRRVIDNIAEACFV